jgi:hypothetical protein
MMYKVCSVLALPVPFRTDRAVQFLALLWTFLARLLRLRTDWGSGGRRIA